MRNPFEKAPENQNAIPSETLRKWKTMQEHLNDRTDLSRLQPEAAKVIGGKIESDWQKWSKDSEQLFPEQFKDSSGRECTRYSGDIAAAFRPWNIPPLKVKLAEVTHFQGKSYLKGKEPESVRRAMVLAKHGFSE
ncbi:hypothetical protein LptCag_1213 [Leptospirillum ferriphilum]|uniref:Uncharacterized protein n=1 Tax=Leptospirillum ferriphilum TaxID=178606 RepID=A0A094WD56_9BACT|nr:hypothetical protein [Leptospirillum ferriphilum]KGA94450.1 hypothetical protein LptCag_1213 [Leptospirillum ferriphilum]